MIITEIYKGQGLGNQLACYITTRVIALDKGYDFGIMNPQNFKGLDFFDLDFGRKITGGEGPEGGPPTKLPLGIKHYYRERKIVHPENGSDISLYDNGLINVADDTKIDGNMQGEEYFSHRKNEIRKWLRVKEEFECYEYADDNTCVINFRGGEYIRHNELYLSKKYWIDAVDKMLSINKNFRFIVITDDVFAAKKIFPRYDVFHFNIAKDYVVIKNAKYLILSNSSFAWFPAWLNEDLRYCIAPKYWARHNISNGYWSLGCNLTKGWWYLDKDGAFFDYDACKKKLDEYIKEHSIIYNSQTKEIEKILTSKIKEKIPLGLKNIIKSAINKWKNTINYARMPFDKIAEKKRRKTWLTKIELSEYRKKIKIFDIFIFFNELELLEIRLNILGNYVDYFVIVEATKTFTGKPKPLYFKENKDRFKKWERKIIHHVTTDTPETNTDKKCDQKILELANSNSAVPKGQVHWLREFYQKEMMKKPLESICSDSDICYVSDIDEIWNPEIFIDYSREDVYKYKQKVYAYYLNNRSNEAWAGTYATKYKNIKNNSVNDLDSEAKTKYTYINNGGWHFTNMGGLERVIKKLESYGHQEFNNSKIKSELEKKINENKDFVGRYFKFWVEEKDLPQYLLKNKEKYKGFFK